MRDDDPCPERVMLLKLAIAERIAYFLAEYDLSYCEVTGALDEIKHKFMHMTEKKGEE